MKKIITLFVLFFAFTYSAQAQSEDKPVKRTAEESAKQDVFDLTKSVDTNGNDAFFVDLYNLFLKKHKELEKASTEAEKKQIYEMIDGKLKATLSPAIIETIKSQPGLYEKLTH